MRRFIVAALVAPFVVLPGAAPAAAACGRVPGDFNGDGYGDLAVDASRRADPANTTTGAAGALNIAYGSASGIGKGRASITLRASSAGMPDPVLLKDTSFGQALAYGYFDGDCYADLAVGAWSVSSTLILYGSSTGLTTARSQVFGSEDVKPGATVTGMGQALASGDFNGDGYADIAAGAPWTSEGAGAVGVLYGSAAGITTTGAQWIDQDSPNVPGAAEPDDRFGRSLAAGDFNGDGRADLAVGAPGEAIGNRIEAGGVVVLSGTASGLTTTGSRWWDQDSAGVPGVAESWDAFGSALVAGDTNGDGRAELVVSAPHEKLGEKASAGMVTLFRGSASSLVAGPAFDQDNTSIPGAAEPGEAFGATLALVDLNRDGKRDLVIGVPGESVGSASSTGAINVLFSGGSGPAVKGALFVDQNSAGVPGANETGDIFGATLSRLSNAYGGEALVVASVNEKVTYLEEGAVTVLPSAPKGKPRPAGYFFTGANFPGGAAKEANFGDGLA